MSVYTKNFTVFCEPLSLVLSPITSDQTVPITQRCGLNELSDRIADFTDNVLPHIRVKGETNDA